MVKRKSVKRISDKKKGSGKTFKTYKEMPEEDFCPICHETYSDTKNLVIFKTTCGHTMHNNCLNIYCNKHMEETVCPICRSPLQSDDVDDCMTVDAFQYKAMGRFAVDDYDEIPFEDAERDPLLLRLYNTEQNENYSYFNRASRRRRNRNKGKSKGKSNRK
jgi:hypothetical protein